MSDDLHRSVWTVYRQARGSDPQAGRHIAATLAIDAGAAFLWGRTIGPIARSTVLQAIDAPGTAADILDFAGISVSRETPSSASVGQSERTTLRHCRKKL